MSCHVMAQETIVTGTITDVSDGSPLIGANILVKGTGVGSIADVKGEYSVKVPVGKHILVFSCIGYKEQEITIKAGQKVLNVMMTEDSELLDEVVVVGYGTMKKSDLTGSVTSIKSEELMKTNPVSINQSLQGRIAGVQVNQNDGAPGAGISIQIRGANSFSTSTEPLYVVDGIPFTTGGTPGAGRDEDGMLQSANPLSSINPADIESVEVLKDASATAIYGSRGANGVVLITTKRGVKGKENISFSANFGISKVVKKMDMLDGYTYAKYRNEATEMFNEYDGAREALPYPGKELLNTSTGEYEYAPGPDDYRNGTCAWTNWQDQVFETALSQEYNLSVNGASDKGYYAISGNILDQEGTIRNSGYKRYSFRANIARKIHKWIEIGTNMSFTNSLNKLAKTNSVSNGIMHGTLFYPATEALDNGTDNAQLNWFSSNPYVYTRAAKDELTTNTFFSSSYLELTPIKDLKIRQNVGFSYNMNERNVYYNRETVEGKDPDNGFASKTDNWAKNLVLETMATYNKEFNKNHSLNAVIAFSYERGDYGNKAMTAKGFPQDITEDFDMSAAVNPNKPISGRGMTSLVSFLGRANYSLMNKYLFTASFRRDGSSKFAPGNKWSNFASGAIAWRASEEEFIKSLNIFSNLKIRASYGQTGNQAIGAYATRDYLTVANYPINGALASGFANLTWRGPANPDLKWETTTQYNAGIDMGFFENRVNFTVDVYYKKTSDLLQNIQIPQSTGFSNMTTNFGDVINKGLEITGKFYPISGKKFKWDFDANISFNRNKIEGLPGDQFAQSWSDADAVFIQRNGMPIGTIFGYVEDGFYDNIAEVRADPFYANESEAVCKSMIGEVKYKDLDGKPGITDADRQIIGDANPDFTFGMTHNFSYKNFSLSFFLQGCVGGDIFNANLIKVTMSGIGNIPQEMYDTRWTPENRDLAQWPKAYSGYGRTMKLSDRYVEDGSYLRMKNINLGYRWNAPIKGIEYINFYTSVSNVFTITNYSWFDPDVNSFGGDASRRGVDMFSYPSSRTFSFGVQCTF